MATHYHAGHYILDHKMNLFAISCYATNYTPYDTWVNHACMTKQAASSSTQCNGAQCYGIGKSTSTSPFDVVNLSTQTCM